MSGFTLQLGSLAPIDVGSTIADPIESAVGSIVKGTEQGITQDTGAVTSVAKDAKNLASGTASIGKYFWDFATLNFSDVALIAVGVIMALGALLISQKQTIVKVGNVAAKAAALGE